MELGSLFIVIVIVITLYGVCQGLRYQVSHGFGNGKPRFIYHLREEALASKDCENTLLFVCLVFVSKATENETNREVGKPSLVKLVKHVRLV